MRDIMQIIEDESTEAEPKLAGQLDAVGLAQLLGSVNDVPTFQAAIAALKSGATLTQPQQVQLARAFISLLDATPQQRHQIGTKLQTVGAPTLAPPQDQS